MSLDLLKNQQLAILLYNIFIRLIDAALRIAAVFNIKARNGVNGRKETFLKMKSISETRQQPLIWMHCASLGEFEQGRPVLESLKKEYPGIIIVLTFFSASGFETMKNYKGADHILYLPLDNSSNAKKMVDILQPSLVLWIKYEFWYYYLHEIKKRNIPVLLISGIFRQNNPFFKWYGGIWREMLLCFTHFFVQNEKSEILLSTIGIQVPVTISGDTRFDRVIEIAEKFEPLPFIEKFCGGNRVLVAGSTWEEDEAELTHYVKSNPDIKFIIAPHEIDPGNLKDVKDSFSKAVFYSDLLKDLAPTGNNPIASLDSSKNNQLDSLILPNVLIIDNVGMLSRLYHYADITYVGGGFGADGVHNVLEAAVYGKPVIFGPEFEKYVEAIGLVECGGGITIQNAMEFERTLNELWENKIFLMGKGNAAKNYVYSNAGASKKIIQFIQEKRLLIS